ncbi:MAG: transposase [Phycisphaerales bacterium]
MDRAYLITFHTYGTWLHGVEKGWVEPGMNVVGMEFGRKDEGRLRRDTEGLRHGGVVLGEEERRVVEGEIRRTCELRGWRLHAINVRTNHVHVVVTAKEEPEHVMTSFKAWATKALRARGLVGEGTKVWSRHGSTRWLHKETTIVSACDYVNRLQSSEAVRARVEKKRRWEEQVRKKKEME